MSYMCVCFNNIVCSVRYLQRDPRRLRAPQGPFASCFSEVDITMKAARENEARTSEQHERESIRVARLTRELVKSLGQRLVSLSC